MNVDQIRITEKVTIAPGALTVSSLHLRVGMNGGVLELAGNSASGLGVLSIDLSSNLAVMPRTPGKVTPAIASGAISQFAVVFADADGKCSASGSTAIGVAMSEAGGDGSLFDLLWT